MDPEKVGERIVIGAILSEQRSVNKVTDLQVISCVAGPLLDSPRLCFVELANAILSVNSGQVPKKNI
jgi:hypothetical protein